MDTTTNAKIVKRRRTTNSLQPLTEVNPKIKEWFFDWAEEHFDPRVSSEPSFQMYLEYEVCDFDFEDQWFEEILKMCGLSSREDFDQNFLSIEKDYKKIFLQKEKELEKANREIVTDIINIDDDEDSPPEKTLWGY